MDNNTSRYQKLFLTISIIALFISVAAIIWAGSKIDSKADTAYKFIEKNYSLPNQVEHLAVNVYENTRKIEKFQDSINLIIKVQAKQEDICQRLENLTKDLKEVEKIHRD